MKMPWEDNIIYNNTVIGTASIMPTDYDFREAIPIEWIKRYCDKQPKIFAYGFSFESTESIAIKNMLRAWEKENE